MASRRSLWPREHGAYVQLVAPLATALAIRTPTVAGIALATAACLAFLANEPLLLVRGHRGPRMRAEHGERAERRLAILVIGAVVTGGIGIAFAPAAALVLAGFAALPAALMIGLAWIRAEHSWWGELVAAVALPAAAAPVAASSGLAWQDAATISLAWAAGYSCAVVAVHRVIARHRRPATWRDGLAAAVLATLTLVAVAAVAFIPALVATIPLVAISTVLVIRPPPASRLRAIGVALVIASVFSVVSTLAVV